MAGNLHPALAGNFLTHQRLGTIVRQYAVRWRRTAYEVQIAVFSQHGE